MCDRKHEYVFIWHKYALRGVRAVRPMQLGGDFRAPRGARLPGLEALSYQHMKVHEPYIVGSLPKVPECNFCRFLDFDINGKINDQAILWPIHF
jgi:hypothetical protein